MTAATHSIRPKLYTVLATLPGLVSRRHAERELDEELPFHVEMETQANTAAGMSPAEARRVAMRDLGGITQTTESVRSVRTLWLDTLSRDVHLAVRRVRRQPAISTCIVFLVALGVAVTAAVFSVLDAVVFKPLPFSKSDELIAFGGRPTRSQVPLLPICRWRRFATRPRDPDRWAPVQWLDAAYRQRCYLILWSGITPLHDSLRGDPRYKRLLRRLKLPRS